MLRLANCTPVFPCSGETSWNRPAVPKQQDSNVGQTESAADDMLPLATPLEFSVVGQEAQLVQLKLKPNQTGVRRNHK